MLGLEILVNSFLYGCSIGLFFLGVVLTIAGLIGAINGMHMASVGVVKSTWFCVNWVRCFIWPPKKQPRSRLNTEEAVD